MNYKIAILPGDGIGKEVTDCGVNVLKFVADRFGYDFQFEYGLIGHAAIEKTGVPLPEETLNLCQNADAILLGAVGHPMYDKNPSLNVRPEQGLLKVRKELGLYTNIRPIKIFDELIAASSLKPEVLRGADILFFRELTGGIYFGDRNSNSKAAFDTMSYSKEEVQRIVTKAFKAAKNRRGRLHSIDKANVLDSSRLWRSVVQELAVEFPEVEVIHMYVDNAAMQLIRDPKQFDVVVTGNMFGDILTDEASQIAGSLGMLPSASVGDRVGLYEPVHGSAPDIAGKNIANPLATILSTALMLDNSFEMKEASQCVIRAVEAILKKGFRTLDTADESTEPDKILGTNEIGMKVLKALEAKTPVSNLN